MIKITRFIILLSLVANLQGCFFVVGAAAGAATVAVVNDHRSIEEAINDAKIANEISANIDNIPGLKEDSHIEVTVFNKVVLLTGETPRAAWRERAEAQARAIPKISRVYNQITLRSPTSALTRTSDAWITTKIKTQMLANGDLKSGDIKVITDNGVTYLMGTLTQQQANLAVDIARQVSGVERVVKVFQYRK
jgi:osmotically-inducible protein OsmY